MLDKFAYVCNEYVSFFFLFIFRGNKLQSHNPRGHILNQDMRYWETYDE